MRIPSPSTSLEKSEMTIDIVLYCIMLGVVLGALIFTPSKTKS